MFRNTFQNGLLSIFFSCGANPLALWDMEAKNGHVKRITDAEVNSIVLEIVSTNVTTTFISCPKNNQYLGIKLPFLVMIVKNLKRYFSFEIMILDDQNLRRRFRISNFQSTTKIKPFCTSMPIGLSSGWNQIQFNLSDFTRRAYGTQYMEALRVQVHANVRLRRIYFAERLYTEEELPQDYKLYLPLDRKQKVKKAKEKKTEALAKVSVKGTAAATPIPVSEAEQPPTPVAAEITPLVIEIDETTEDIPVKTEVKSEFIEEAVSEAPGSEVPVSEAPTSEVGESEAHTEQSNVEKEEAAEPT